MDQNGYILLFVAVSGVALLVLSAAIRYGFRYGMQIRRVKMEIRRAQTPLERNRWRRELRALWVSVFLGVSLDRARQMCKRAYR